MTALAELLLAPGRREAVERRVARWVERYVAQRGGLRGVALRSGLGAAKAAWPDVVARAVSRLLPDFLDALEPLYLQARAEDRPFAAYLEAHSAQAAESLIAAAERRVAATGRRSLLTAWRPLRGTLAAELRTVLPEVGRLVEDALP